MKVIINYQHIIIFFFSCVLKADVPIDGDEPDHINWIMTKSIERANEFKISGITYRLTQGEFND